MLNYNCQIAFMKLLESSSKVAEIQARLAKYTFLSRNNLPGYLDGIVLQNLKLTQTYPDRGQYPNFYHWYILMRQFATSTITKWIQDSLYYDPQDLVLENFFKQTELPPQIPLQRHESAQGAQIQSIQLEYEIDILLKEYSEQVLEQLRRCLCDYRLQISTNKPSREVMIKCGYQSPRSQEIVNLISRAIEYENLQVKRVKKSKTSFRQRSTTL